VPVTPTDPARHPRSRTLPAGVGAALLAGALFGAGTPLAKALMAEVGPWMLAGLLYLGYARSHAAAIFPQTFLYLDRNHLPCH
jgi:drug/metabolite transporter (DMT)-like permease